MTEYIAALPLREVNNKLIALGYGLDKANIGFSELWLLYSNKGKAVEVWPSEFSCRIQPHANVSITELKESLER